MTEEESPTPGKSAGLVRGIVYSSATTAEASDKFQPATKASQSNHCRQRRKFTKRRRAFLLLRQVQGLARWRCAQGVGIDVREEGRFAWVLAKILVTTTPSFEEGQRLNRLRDIEDPGHGLDFVTLSRAMKDAGLGSLSEPEVMTIIHKVQDWHDEHPNCPIDGEAVGKGLGLSAKERHEVGCWNILAIDESKSQRAEQRKQRKREADKERARRKREGKHVPRSEYLAQAERRRTFCQEHGISDRTLRRWIAKDDPSVRSLSHGNISSKQQSDRLRTSVAKTQIHRQRSQNIGETMSASLHTVSNETLLDAAFHPADGANEQGFQAQQRSPVGIAPSRSVELAMQASPTAPGSEVAIAYHAGSFGSNSNEPSAIVMVRRRHEAHL